MKRKNKPQLNPADARRIQGKVESEGGIDYAFRFYSHFPEVKDKRFRKLYRAYIKAAQELADYCGLDEESDDGVGEYGDCDSCGLKHYKDERCPDSCGDCGDDLNDGICETCEGEGEN